MDLTIYFEKIVRGFSLGHNYTLGSELRDKSREIVGLIIKANSTAEKLPPLVELRNRLKGLKVVIRICKESRALGQLSAYVFGSSLVVELSRQNEGWIKGQNKG